MGTRCLDRRRFLKASAALAMAVGMGERPSRGDELGVDAGPFATDNEVIREARRVALAILKPREGELRACERIPIHPPMNRRLMSRAL
jgi:hypothetical protein